jgi:hypothetical protein
MIEKYSKLAANSIFRQLYTFFLLKKLFYFFFSLKVRYNWYNWNYIAVPTLIRSNLYLSSRYNEVQKVQLKNKG